MIKSSERLKDLGILLRGKAVCNRAYSNAVDLCRQNNAQQRYGKLLDVLQFNDSTPLSPTATFMSNIEVAQHTWYVEFVSYGRRVGFRNSHNTTFMMRTWEPSRSPERDSDYPMTPNQSRQTPTFCSLCHSQAFSLRNFNSCHWRKVRTTCTSNK